MSKINCYIPIKLRITGRPSDSQLDQLGDALVRALTARMAFAERVIEDRHVSAVAGDYQPVREAYDPEREEGATDSYLVPSYKNRGDKEPIKRLRRAQSGPPWVILATDVFRARVGRFLSIIDSLSQNPDDLQNLYFDQLEEICPVVTWVVKVNREQLMRKDLVPQLDKTVRDKSKHKQFFRSVAITSSSYRRKLIEIAENGRVSAKLPNLDVNHNKKLILNVNQPTDGSNNHDIKLLPGALVLFAWMNLPEINLTERVTLNQWSDIKVPWREVEIVHTNFQNEFKSRFNAQWESFKLLFGNDLTTLRLMPFVVRSRTPFPTLKYLMEDWLFKDFPKTKIPIGDLYILNQDSRNSLPEAAHLKADQFSNDVTRDLNKESRLNHWEAGWAGAYVYVVDDPAPDQLAGVKYIPEARSLAALLRKLLSSDPTKLEWSDMAHAFLNEHYGSNPDEESRRLSFDFLLRELCRDAAFNRLFDIVERFGRENLQELLARLTFDTIFADEYFVQSWLDRIGSRAESNLRHTYRENEILLYHKTAVSVGQVFGDVVETGKTFIFERKERRLKHSRVNDFREAFVEKQGALIGKMARDENTNQYDQLQFAAAALGAAARQIKLVDEDFESVTIQKSIKVLRVEKRKTLPRFQITYVIVERLAGGTWQPAAEPGEVSAKDFEATLLLWVLGSAGKLFESAAMPILVIGVVALAWEAGIIAALVEFAGGGWAVGLSIGLNEVILVLRCLKGSADFTLENVLEEALSGYINALGFKLAGGAIKGGVSLLAKKFGGAALRWLITQRLATGIFGGAASSAAIEFMHNFIDVVIKNDGEWSSSEVYWEKMLDGAGMGFFFEFAIATGPLFLRAVAKEELRTLSQAVKLLFSKGIKSAEWTAAMAEVIANLRAKFNIFIADRYTQGLFSAIWKRVLWVAKQLGGEYKLAVFRNVLELAPEEMSRSAVQGLAKFLGASHAELSNEAALSILNKLKPNQLSDFLEVLNNLRDSSTRRVFKFLSNSNASQADELLRLLSESGPEQESLDKLVKLVFAERENILSEERLNATLKKRKNPVYREYSAAREKNSFITSNETEHYDGIKALDEERLADETLKQTIKDLADKGLLDDQPRFPRYEQQTTGRKYRHTTFHHFIRVGVKKMASGVNIYLHVKSDRAMEVMKFVVRKIVDNPGEFPGIAEAKVAGGEILLGPGEALPHTQSGKATQLRMTGSSGPEKPPVILYRGTTYQFIHGGSKNLHDLGDGLYLTYEPGLALQYAQEHRVKVNVDSPGAPGIVIRVETNQEELGRVLDLYNNKVLKDEWESYLEIFESGRNLKRGLANENYSRFFETWLKNRGMDVSQFDTIIGPEYVRGGSQICVRNKTIAERFIAKAEEWARAREPLSPAYPDPALPIDKKLLDKLKE